MERYKIDKRSLKGLSTKQKAFILAYCIHFPHKSRTCEASGVSRQVFYDWMRKDTKFADIVTQIEESVLDELEGKAIELAIDKNDPAMVRFLLEAKGRDRGYGQSKVELTGPNNGPLEITVNKVVVTRKEKEG